MFCPNPECPDLELSGVRGEYADGVTICARCGAYLVDVVKPDRPVDDSGVEPLLEDPEAFFESWAPTEIPVIKSILEGAKIPYATRGENPFHGSWVDRGVFRLSPSGGAVVFLVPARHAEAVRDLLTEMETKEDPE